MQSPIRFLLSTVGGGIFATGLGLAMVSMIRVEFSPQGKADKLIYEINPEIVDPPVLINTRRDPELKQVEVPPAPPEIEKADKVKVYEDPIDYIEGVDIDFPKPVLEPNDNWLSASKSEFFQPMKFPPAMPPQAAKSGRCEMQFDVAPDGSTFNVAAMSCSQSLFKRASVKAVQRWKYPPIQSTSQHLDRTGLKETIVFRLLDERGKLIPE